MNYDSLYIFLLAFGHLASSCDAEKKALKDYVSKYQGHSECCLSAKIYVGIIRCSLALCVSVWNDKHYQDIFFKSLADISYLHRLEDVMPYVCVPVKCKLLKMNGNCKSNNHLYLCRVISTSLRLFHQGIGQAACLWTLFAGHGGFWHREE